MDFDALLAGYKNKTCIMSVDILPDGHYGNIRIVAGNKAHCDDMENIMHRPFIPDSPYEHYLPQNRNFEDYCYRSAVLGQPLHTYVRLPQMGLWLNMFLLPLQSDREDKGYCIYSYDVTPNADSETRASLSAETSSAVLQTCIKLRGAEDVRAAFYEVIEDIRNICESDYCCVMTVDHETRSCTTFCESIKEGSGILPMDTYLDENFYNLALTWKDTLADSTCIIIKDERDMKWLESVNPLWHKSLTEAGVRNIVLFPLDYNGETLAYMWALEFNAGNTVKIKETLELTSFFMASELANYRLLKRLEMMGSMDMLTGVKNRNAMNNDISDILSGKKDVKHPYAVVFADLNGLKRVNDEDGHSEGDNLLRMSADILRDVFTGGEVYRAGGDEFMILSPGTGEAELDKRIGLMHARAEASGRVHFAVGTYIVGEDGDILTAMRTADEKMYSDKKEYYELHPDRRYR